ncbi:hypothetical protein RBB79_05945 [Tunturiibacter empetritectus]|uniref:rRNA-processing protein FCF1 n=2 Tax=Tunturiibacter TaxID=3154218 RepID=A0A852VBK9_9BACT|nr:hypothetical protein [Edaphobacter lichenicola]NYF89070.1 rRNA-processing protein FCF1 [Edaphobacter lichenicola]
MGPDVSFPIQNSRNKIVVLDTNLLLLAISARVGLHRFGSFSRVNAFTAEDAKLLSWIVSQFKAVATTAYVLAEVSNLANKLTGSLRSDWFLQLQAYAFITIESHVPIQTIGKKAETVRFGVTDSALSHLSNNHTILTAEFRLSGYLESIGREVLNFNHLRRFNR